MSNKYWVNSGVIKASGPSSLNTYTGFDDIVCDILKCKFGLDCCTGEDGTPADCCVQFANSAEEINCDTFTGRYWINNLGEVWECRGGEPSLTGNLLIHFPGVAAMFSSGADEMTLSRTDNGQTTSISMTTPLVDPLLVISIVDDADVTNITSLQMTNNNITIQSSADTAINNFYVQVQDSLIRVTYADVVTPANNKEIAVSAAGIVVTGLGNYADDTAAAVGGVPLNGLYHNAGALRIRIV